MTPTVSCPCRSAKAYPDCCGLYIGQGEPAPTAEALMRSRYTAYSANNERYLLKTWHHSTRPEKLNLDQHKSTRWIGLKVIKARDGGTHDTTGTVEFVARYKVGGKAHRLHEVSRFIKEDGRWYYVDGEMKA